MPRIAVLAGDGIGPEIVGEALRLLGNLKGVEIAYPKVMTGTFGSFAFGYMSTISW